MKNLVFLLFMICQSCLAQEVWTDQNRILPDKLRNTPTGLLLTHSPNPNYAELNNYDNDYTYKWEHVTCVKPLISGLKVVEIGSFIWIKSKGWITNMQLNPSQFKKRFATKDKELIDQKTYCYEKNIRWGNTLFDGDALWFVLAKDAQGNLYKGIGIIETEGKLLN